MRLIKEPAVYRYLGRIAALGYYTELIDCLVSYCVPGRWKIIISSFMSEFKFCFKASELFGLTKSYDDRTLARRAFKFDDLTLSF